jgi:hypothetical protein
MARKILLSLVCFEVDPNDWRFSFIKLWNKVKAI